MSFRLSDYTYDLPVSSIAQTAVSPAHNARLLVCKAWWELIDQTFTDLPLIVPSGSVFFYNNSYVINARIPLHNVKTSPPAPLLQRGGAVKTVILEHGEIFVYKLCAANSFECLVSDGKHFRPGTTIHFSETIRFVSERFMDDGILMRLEWAEVLAFLAEYGQMPLPPYISYAATKAHDYQTTFADPSRPGSVAAPTASLHFTPTLLASLHHAGHHTEYITLHVGLGTFKPMIEEDIRDIHLHTETVTIDLAIFTRIFSYKKNHQTLIAVGTTVARTLESLPYVRLQLSPNIKNDFSPDVRVYWDGCAEDVRWMESPIRHSDPERSRRGRISSSSSQNSQSWDPSLYSGWRDHQSLQWYITFDTSIYIYPGRSWRVVDRLITNFHLPRTSLLLLVASRLPTWKSAYEHAIRQGYRFYSFGDGMLI